MFPFIDQLNENEVLNGHFQYGVTAHTAWSSMEFLEEIFGERIISKGLWPPLFPYLKPHIFLLLLGVEKGVVYQNSPKTIENLKTAIIAFSASVSQNMLTSLFANKSRRVALQTDKEKWSIFAGSWEQYCKFVASMIVLIKQPLYSF